MNEGNFGCFATVGIVVLFILAAIVPLNIKNRADGVHTGYITAIEDITSLLDEEGGAFNGTRIYVKTDLSSSQEDKYCVQDSNKSLIDDLKNASKSKANVSITFDNYSFTGFGNCSGDIITKVELVK
jgi:hypothetical protein